MPFKLLTISAMSLLVIVNFLVLPQVLNGLRSNPQFQTYVTDPDLTFQLFSQCKKQVVDAEACYQAYSAAVALANSEDCSVAGIALQRRFKHLVEHSTPAAIENEIAKKCPVVQTGL
ncbi:hypothetical protein GV819_20585 [Pseudomonas sp. Fl5BN2]|uniref:hypothetical protein n=1 Tax=Pseudomonas sp. Fl5BN2 TaxID=2697652 RepID=UPI001378872F|nr:hypothetical protein [Pseudomonas sp. Fl5BN2]NBF04683.1 hypothetical protein [Pseudomonas sp. Fl5BN2]